MPAKYPEGSVSPSGEYIVRGGQWVAVAESAPVEKSTEPKGGALERFAGGVWDATGKPMMEAFPELLETATSPPIELTKDEEGGIGIESKPLEFWKRFLSGAASAQKKELLKVLEEDSSLLEKGGHLAAGLTPLIGPAAAQAGERIAEGDVAGGLGEGVGLALPFVRPFKAMGATGKAAKALRGSADRNIMRAIGTRDFQVEKLLPHAEEISKGLKIGGSKALSKRAGDVIRDEAGKIISESGRVAKAKAKLKEVKASPAAQDYKGTLKGATERLEGSLDKIELPKSGEAVTGQKFTDWVQSQKGKKLPKAVKESLVSMDEGALKATTKIQKKLTQLEKLFGEGKVPGEAMFKIRKHLGDVARREGAYGRGRIPGTKISSKGEASKLARAEITKDLHEAIPGLREADISYSTWREVADNLKKQALKSEVGGAPAFELAGGAKGMQMALAKTAGAVAGGGAAATAAGPLAAIPFGAYGAFQVTREIVNSPLWNTLSANHKYALAEALSLGMLPKATVVGSTIGRTTEEMDQ